MNAFSDGVHRHPDHDPRPRVAAARGTTISATSWTRRASCSPTLLSFVMVGIYWNNHHHLMQIVKTIDGRTLWANMHLLFWLSLMPLSTAWLGEAGVEPGPVAAYAIVLLGCAIAFSLLTIALLALHESSSQLAQAIGRRPQGQDLARVLRRSPSRLRVRGALALDRAASSPSRSSGSCPTAGSSASSQRGVALSSGRDDAQRLRPRRPRRRRPDAACDLAAPRARR